MKTADKEEIKCMEKALQEKFEQFYKDKGISDTSAIENYISMYMEELKKMMEYK